MPRVLFTLVSRATQLAKTCVLKVEQGSTDLETIHTVSSIACSLCAFTFRHATGNPPGLESFVEPAKMVCRSLQRCLDAFPPEAKISSKVLGRIFRCVCHGRSFVPLQSVLCPLLLHVDAHVDASELKCCLPGDLLAGLYAIVLTTQPSSTPMLLSNLMLSMRQHLSKLRGKEAALLLWSLAALGQTEHVLWKQTCSQCLFLYKKMNSASHVKLMQALLMCEQCSCDGQLQLLKTIRENLSVCQAYEEDFTNCDVYEANYCKGEEHALWFISHSDARPRTDAIEISSYQGLRLHLFRSAHLLNAELLLQLLGNLWCSKKSYENVKDVEFFFGDEVLLLLEQLSHKRLSPDQSVRLLLLLETQGVFHDFSDNELPKLHPVQAAVVRAANGLMDSGPDRITNRYEALYTLLLLLQVAASGRSTSFCFHMLSRAFTSQSRQRMTELLIDLTQKCHEQIEVAPDGVDGATLWVLALVASWVQQQRYESQSFLLNPSLDNDLQQSLEHTVAQIDSLATTCLDGWQKSSTLSLAEECVSLLCTGCQTHTSLRPLLSRSSVARNLLSGCIEVVSQAKTLCWTHIFHLLSTFEAVRWENSTTFPLLSAVLTLNDYLVQRLDLVDIETHNLSLHKVEMFLCLSTQTYYSAELLHITTPAVVKPRIQRNFNCVPNALLDLYIRLLMQDSPCMTKHQARILVQCIENRASCGAKELEKAFMLICTCRFCHKKPLLEAVLVPPQALVRLIELASVLHVSQVPTSVTIISMLLRVLMDSGVAMCMDISSLNDLASLLLLPICSELKIKESLVERIRQRVIEISKGEVSADTGQGAEKNCELEKGYLIAHLVRANAPVAEDLLFALRRSAF